MPHRTRFGFGKVENESLLLVEGIDDARFFSAFLRNALNKTDVQVVQVGSKDNFRPFIRNTLIRAEGFRDLRRLGIVRDADTNAQSALQSLKGALNYSGLPAPTGPWEVADGDEVRVSVAILPDGSEPGDLEALCLRSLQNQALTQCVDTFIDCVANQGPSIADNKLAKAKVAAYLAPGPVRLFEPPGSIGPPRRDPGLHVGEAAEAGIWDWSSPAFEQIAEFLRKL